jgi:hypothetical protein
MIYREPLSPSSENPESVLAADGQGQAMFPAFRSHLKPSQKLEPFELI